MGAHPWKVEDLSVKTRHASESSCNYYTQADDDDWLEEYDEDDLCPFCFQPDTDGNHCCLCEGWDDDCWADDTFRPWLHGPDLVDLTEKGEAMQRECEDNFYQELFDVEERNKIRKARRRWMVLKDAVDAKRVALYWQEQTQRGLCAPDGAGRAADAAAFQAEF